MSNWTFHLTDFFSNMKPYVLRNGLAINNGCSAIIISYKIQKWELTASDFWHKIMNDEIDAINESAKNQKCWLEISIQPWAKRIFTECSYQAWVIDVCIKWTYETWVQALDPGPCSTYFSWPSDLHQVIHRRSGAIFKSLFFTRIFKSLCSKHVTCHTACWPPPSTCHDTHAFLCCRVTHACATLRLPQNAKLTYWTQIAYSDKWLVLVCRRISLLNYCSFNAGKFDHFVLCNLQSSACLG